MDKNTRQSEAFVLENTKDSRSGFIYNIGRGFVIFYAEESKKVIPSLWGRVWLIVPKMKKVPIRSSSPTRTWLSIFDFCGPKANGRETQNKQAEQTAKKGILL